MITRLHTTVVLLLTACSPDAPKADGACTNTTQCALGSLCHVPSGTCQLEREEHVMGVFSCIPTEHNIPSMGNSYSDVVGRFGGRRYTFNLFATCVVQADGSFNLIFSGLGADGWNHDFSLFAPVAQPGRYEIVAGDTETLGSNQAAAMVFRYYGQDTYVDPPLAQSASGEMFLHGPVVPGQPLEGFIDCTMMGIGQSGCGLAFGEDCNPCFEQACCAQGAACGDSDNCLAFVACWSDCPSGDAACDNGCAAAYPQGSALFAAVVGCLNQNCEAQCF
jgi:hypothetical protein